MKNIINFIIVTVFLGSCTFKDESKEMFNETISGANEESKTFFKKLRKEEKTPNKKPYQILAEQDKIELERLKRRKKTFTETLKREYLKLSEKLMQANDYTSATYFRRKAYNVDTHLDIMPEKPEDWKIKQDYALNALRIARMALINSLNFNVISVAPKPAAQAIAYYDCWVEQEQNRWRKDEQNCRETFRQAQAYIGQVNRETKGKGIEELKKEYEFIDLEDNYEVEKLKPEPEKYQGAYRNNTPIVKEPEMQKLQAEKASSGVSIPKSMSAKALPKITTPKTATANVPTKNEAANKPKIQNTGFIVADAATEGSDLAYLAYFENDLVTLNDKAKTEIDKAADQINKAKPSTIILNGHTDKSFDNETSLEISKQRADATRDYLISKGIDKNIIRTYGFGKTDNLVKNKDGEKVSANNRVEIIFKNNAESKKE